MKQKSWFRSLLECALSACLLAFLAKALLFFVTDVEGTSMQPTLLAQDKILVNRLPGYVHQVKHGDIVVLKTSDYYVKRVIALPGEKVQMIEDKLYVDGRLQAEPYLSKNQQEAHRLMMRFTENFGPIEVPKGELFVMGDNRKVSRDSRNGLGFIKQRDVLGTVEAIYYPFSHIRRVK